MKFLKAPILFVCAAAVLVPSPLPAAVLGDWIFNDGSGTTAVDGSGTNAHATLVNFADTTPGAGNAGISGWTTDGRLALDGTNDHLTTPLNLSLLQGRSFTLETIVSHDNPTQTWSPILGQSEASTARIFYFGKQQGSNAIHYNLAGLAASVNTLIPFADSAMHHLALVFNDTADTITLFVDGTERHARTGVTGVLTTNTTLMIGGIGHAAGERWNGYVDRVRISDEALTADQFVIPEPGSALLLGCGVGGLLLRRRR